VQELSPASMDVLEKRIGFMANQSLKSPRESRRKKEIDKVVTRA